MFQFHKYVVNGVKLNVFKYITIISYFGSVLDPIIPIYCIGIGITICKVQLIRHMLPHIS